MSKYKNISTADLKAIYDFTNEEIAKRNSISNKSATTTTQLSELREVNSLIYDELLTRALTSH
jgi:hypothetical protein